MKRDATLADLRVQAHAQLENIMAVNELPPSQQHWRLAPVGEVRLRGIRRDEGGNVELDAFTLADEGLGGGSVDLSSEPDPSLVEARSEHLTVLRGRLCADGQSVPFDPDCYDPGSIEDFGDKGIGAPAGSIEYELVVPPGDAHEGAATTLRMANSLGERHADDVLFSARGVFFDVRSDGPAVRITAFTGGGAGGSAQMEMDDLAADFAKPTHVRIFACEGSSKGVEWRGGEMWREVAAGVLQRAEEGCTGTRLALSPPVEVAATSTVGLYVYGTGGVGSGFADFVSLSSMDQHQLESSVMHAGQNPADFPEGGQPTTLVEAHLHTGTAVLLEPGAPFGVDDFSVRVRVQDLQKAPGAAYGNGPCQVPAGNWLAPMRFDCTKDTTLAQLRGQVLERYHAAEQGRPAIAADNCRFRGTDDAFEEPGALLSEGSADLWRRKTEIGVWKTEDMQDNRLLYLELGAAPKKDEVFLRLMFQHAIHTAGALEDRCDSADSGAEVHGAAPMCESYSLDSTLGELKTKILEDAPRYASWPKDGTSPWLRLQVGCPHSAGSASTHGLLRAVDRRSRATGRRSIR